MRCCRSCDCRVGRDSKVFSPFLKVCFRPKMGLAGSCASGSASWRCKLWLWPCNCPRPNQNLKSDFASFLIHTEKCLFLSTSRLFWVSLLFLHQELFDSMEEKKRQLSGPFHQRKLALQCNCGAAVWEAGGKRLNLCWWGEGNGGVPGGLYQAPGPLLGFEKAVWGWGVRNSDLPPLLLPCTSYQIRSEHSFSS